MANLKLAQYLVRLQFNDVEKRAPRVSRKDRDAGEQKVKRKRKSYLDPDFDSEEEFGSDVMASEDGSDVEYDDGKMSEGGDDDKDAKANESADSGSLDSDLAEGMSDEEGELEMSEMDEAGESELSEQDGDEEERERCRKEHRS